MSGKIMGKAWDLDLPHNQLLVLLAMSDHADHLGDNVYPSLGLIGWKTGYSEQQVRRIIRQLVALKILVVMDKSPGKTIKYRIDLAAGKQKAEYTPDKMSPPSKSNPLHDEGEVKHPTPDMPSAKIVGEPSVIQPSSNTAPVLPKPEPVKKSGPKPTVEMLFRTEWAKYAETGTALLKEFGLDFVPAANQTMTALEPYLDVAKQLTDAECKAADIPALYKFVSDKAKREEWTQFGVRSLARHYTNFLKSKHDNPTGQPALHPALVGIKLVTA